MTPFYLKRFVAKIFVILGIGALAASSPGHNSKLLFLCQTTLKQGSQLWNTFATKWNNGDKEKMLQSVDDSGFMGNQDELPNEVSAIRDLASQAATLPLLKFSNGNMILYDTETNEELLMVEDLDKIKVSHD